MARVLTNMAACGFTYRERAGLEESKVDPHLAGPEAHACKVLTRKEPIRVARYICHQLLRPGSRGERGKCQQVPLLKLLIGISF